MDKTEIEIEHVGLAALNYQLMPYKRSYHNDGTLRKRDYLAADDKVDLAFSQVQKFMRIMHAFIRKRILRIVRMLKAFDYDRHRTF